MQRRLPTLPRQFLHIAWFLNATMVLACIFPELCAQQNLNSSNGFAANKISSYLTGGDAYGVHVVGKIAYVAADNSGLKIIDISNPNSPKLIGGYTTGGSAMGVQVIGNRAYIADYDGGLKIIDVSNPAAPKLIGKYVTENVVFGVYVVGNRAYVSDGNLHVIDRNRPALPYGRGAKWH